jgi:hypothetical protein
MAAMREVTYRGYSIRFHLRNNWSAQIRRPGGYVVMKNGFLTASVEEAENGFAGTVPRAY